MEQVANPIGLDGIEFVEFTAPEKGVVEKVLESGGFTRIAKHKARDIDLWRQGGINIRVNYDQELRARHFAKEHGASTSAVAFRVKDVGHAMKLLKERGAEFVSSEAGPMEINIPAIRGIGGSLIYLVDRYGDKGSIYDIDFDYLDGVDRNCVGAGLLRVDHLTNNVYSGRMNYWAEFYERLFNFGEYRYFDIKGEYTGLVSRALAAPDGKIFIPINEESGDGNGQIQEFLNEFNGEGIQHIAFITDDLVATYDRLKEAGMTFMTPPPGTYYEALDERLPDHGEDVSAIEPRGILIDGDTGDGEPRILLQIFSENLLGPTFFEFIERKGNQGFGEGNFTALFESIERDQVNRGVLDASIKKAS